MYSYMSSAKKIAEKSIVNTIDEKHTEMLNHFHDIETNTLPKLIAEKNRLKHRLSKLANTNIDLEMEIKDKIQSIRTKIAALKTQRTNYLLDNSKYIFQYFEDKKKISSGENNQNTNALNSFFKIKATTEQRANLQSEKYTSSKKALQLYWKNVNNEVFNIHDFVIPSDICESCCAGELIPQDEEGILICNNDRCGKFITHIVDSAKPANKEPPNEVSYTAYIRLNHFKEILAQFQAKETTQIPEDVVEQIQLQIKKERINLEQLTHYKTKEILKKLGFNKYYEHIAFIKNKLGMKPPVFSPELEEILCNLFMEIQSPYSKMCPDYRVNFLNYYYVLYKFCELLGEDQYLEDIPMLKDREKLIEQDETWKKMCIELDWEFMATV